MLFAAKKSGFAESALMFRAPLFSVKRSPGGFRQVMPTKQILPTKTIAPRNAMPFLDNTMPDRDWSVYDSPTHLRKPARIVLLPFNRDVGIQRQAV